MPVLLFIITACFASFCHVVGYRLPKKQSFIVGRSCCEQCHTVLKPVELIPILSYILLRGRCRHCQKLIPLLSPFLEVLSGFLVVALYSVYGLSNAFFLGFVLVLLFVTISVSDMYYQLIPNRILLFFWSVIFIICLFEPELLFMRIVGSASIFLFLALFAWLSHGGIGGGDVKLYAIIGAVLGLPLAFVSLFLATLCGFVWFFVGRASTTREIPFAPSIAIATMVTYFYGEAFLNWYTH